MMSSQIPSQRDMRLNELSQMVIDGVITNKLDHIATVFIDGRHYFNVFRRYNSTYNIVIEDNNTDIYLHQDYTVRKSLQTVMCLRDCEAANFYTLNATSYKHNGPVPCGAADIADMRWTEIHSNYQAISVNFGGIFQDMAPFAFDNVVPDPPSTPIAQIHSTPLNPPGAPLPISRPLTDEEATHILLSINIPPQPNFFVMSETDGPTLSMRFADVKKRSQDCKYISCYCHMDSDEDDESNYTILRSGTQIPKPFTQ